MEVRWAEGLSERFAEIATEFVQLSQIAACRAVSCFSDVVSQPLISLAGRPAITRQLFLSSNLMTSRRSNAMRARRTDYHHPWRFTFGRGWTFLSYPGK